MNTEHGIRYQLIETTTVASRRFNLKSRDEIHPAIQALSREIPDGLIAGDPYCIIQFFSSYPEGYEAEIGFPVHRCVESDRFICTESLSIEVLSLVHSGSRASLRDTKMALNRHVQDRGLISDEFTREEYPDWQNPDGPVVCQFVIHNWTARFECNLARVLGVEKAGAILKDMMKPGLDASIPERFEWAKRMMERLDTSAEENQRFDIVSSCSHVFPRGQLDRLKHVFQDASRRVGTDPIESVLEFMRTDPGWGEKEILREGNVITHTKNPSDPVAYAAAETPEARRAAYCFCPIIRSNLNGGISDTYCYCGSGWYRQQWEAATGKPVSVRVLKSVVRGDDVCRFEVHLES